MTASLTKKAIQHAFVKLLNEQPLNKISVKDITAELTETLFITITAIYPV